MLALSRRTAVSLIRDGRNLFPTAPTSFSTLNTLSANPSTPSLPGTVPHHTAYVFLHTHSPPADYPSRSKSPLWRALTLNARRWGGIVNFAWSPDQTVHPAYAALGEKQEGEEDAQEAYVASVFTPSTRGRLEIPEITLRNLDIVDAKIHAHCNQLTELETLTTETHPVAVELEHKIFLYVCTHGSRDCRCGNTGGEVARALRSEIAKRDLTDQISVGEVAHVGGHKYAANVLVYPYGDWLATVQDVDVPQILDELMAWHGSHRKANTTTTLPPLCPPFWRGRMGLDKDQQLALISRPAAE